MKKNQLIILSIAVLAAGGAGLMAMRFAKAPPPPKPTIIQAAPKIEMNRVLVAATNISMGANLNNSSMEWQEWPAKSIASGMINQKDEPDAINKLSGATVRSEIYEGEPIRHAKVITGDGGVMAAILPKGTRAVATSISTATSAGGFILPNDHVDVLMTKRVANSDVGHTAEIILENIRVLAIDQTIQEKDGQKVVVGETATLQLTPVQVEILTVAQQSADRLSLSLRSLKDANEASSSEASHLIGNGRGSVRLIRYGKMKISSTAASRQTTEQRTEGAME